MSSAKPPSLAFLSCRLASNALIVENYLTESSRPHLSFEPDKDQELPYGPGFEQLQDAREAIMHDARLLYDLAAGPKWIGTILPIQARNGISSLQIIDHFGLWSIVPLEGSLSYEDIAKRGGLDMYRTWGAIRHAMTLRVFCEPSPGQVAHTALSKLFLDPIFHQWFLFMYGDASKSSSAIRDALEQFGPSTKATETATNVAFGTTGNAMEYLANGDIGVRFGGAMTWFGSIGPLDDRLIVDGYPWSDLGTVKIVDVGGGNGHFSIALAKKYPKFNIVVQDQATQLNTMDLPQSLTGRVSVQEHDFFTSQPVAADVFLFRFILHDWDDEHSARILRALVPALRKGSKILLIESVMDGDPNKDSLSHLVSALNMEMITMLNGHERTRRDWEHLLSMTDPRMEITRVIDLKGSVLSVVEVTWMGDNDVTTSRKRRLLEENSSKPVVTKGGRKRSRLS